MSLIQVDATCCSQQPQPSEHHCDSHGLPS